MSGCAVSLGRDGAVLAADHVMIQLPALDVEARSAVGAGDSFLAGLVIGLERGLSPRQALALGTAAGGAAVMSFGTARVHQADVDGFYRTLCGEPDPACPSGG